MYRGTDYKEAYQYWERDHRVTGVPSKRGLMKNQGGKKSVVGLGGGGGLFWWGGVWVVGGGGWFGVVCCGFYV